MTQVADDVVADLQSRFGIADALRFEVGEGGLVRAVFTTPDAEARAYLHGAHVTHFQLKGEKPLLFLSGRSRFEAGKAIRGGVPVCFPWFGPKAGDPAAPAHGFARLREWAVASTGKADDGSVRLVMTLSDDDATRAVWPQAFRAELIVTVGPELWVRLIVHNTGSEPFTYEAALHTYLSVADVKRVRVDGLDGVFYLDKVDGGKKKKQPPTPITFTGETDRVYLDTRATCTIEDPAGERVTTVAKNGSESTVVWNPWIDKARAMADFGDDEWPDMVCVETCNVGAAAVNVQPGASHATVTVISPGPSSE